MSERRNDQECEDGKRDTDRQRDRQTERQAGQDEREVDAGRQG